MGTHYLFTCHCGYRATVAGDYDINDAGATITIACRTCKRLYDVKLSAPNTAFATDALIEARPGGVPESARA